MRRGSVVLAALVAVCAVCDAAQVPVVTSIEPSSGIISGGTEVKISGENLAFVQHCVFGANRGELVYAHPDGTSVWCKTPSGEGVGTVPVQLSEMDGNDAEWIPVSPMPSTLFKYYAPPAILEVLPASGPATGEKEVQIQTGNGLLSSTDLDKLACMFGDRVVRASSYSCTDSSCYIKCITPQMCFQHDPIDKEHCQESTVAVYVSMNGQDFVSDSMRRPKYTFTNVWAHVGL